MRLGGPRRFAGLLALGMLALLGACEDTIIETAEVDRVRVEPEQARLLVGSSLQLQAEVLDRDGQPITGLPVAWTTGDERVAEVDRNGMVIGRGAGEVMIRATTSGRTGMAALDVATPGRIVLSPQSHGFTTVAGSTDPTPVLVSVTNAGDEPLQALEATVRYPAGEPDGWIMATLESPSADTRLRVAATLGALPAGTYSGEVLISDPAADNSPAVFAVTLDVREGPPDEPTDLDAQSVAGGVRLQWSDNSDNEIEFRIERRDPGDSQFADLGVTGADATTFLDDSVEPDRTYRYRVRACGANACSGPSGEAAALTPPYAPASLSASAASSRSITLSWSDRSTTETGFRIERRTGGGSFAEVGSAGADATEYLDTGLEPETAYRYRVRACNGGGCSAPSGEAQAETPALPVPTAPSGLAVAVQTADSIRLTWTDNSDVETAFEVHRRAPGEAAFGRVASLGANATAYTDSSVDLDGRYVYRVRACAEGGCSAFTADVTGTTPPEPPGSVNSQTLSTTEIRVSWNDPNATTTGLRLERSRSGGTFQEIGQLPPGTDSFDDSGLDPDTRYGYRLRACNEAGCSTYSGETEARTEPLPVPDSPSGLTLRVVGGTSIEASWSDNSDVETRFEIQRRGGGSSTFGTVATEGPDVTTHLDETVSEDASYTYRVRACAAGGCSAFSNEASATTRPLAPSDLAATPESSTSIRLEWTDNSATEVEFTIEKIRGADTTRIRIPANEIDFRDVNLDPNTTYLYRIRSCNDGGCSAFSPSSPVAATTLPPPPPNAPSELTATAVGPTAVDLTWKDNSSDETRFEVWRKAGIEQDFTVLPATINPSSGSIGSHTDPSVQPGIQYTYKVRACGSVCSNFSNEAVVTTPIASIWSLPDQGR